MKAWMRRAAVGVAAGVGVVALHIPTSGAQTPTFPTLPSFTLPTFPQPPTIPPPTMPPFPQPPTIPPPTMPPSTTTPPPTMPPSTTTPPPTMPPSTLVPPSVPSALQQFQNILDEIGQIFDEIVDDLNLDL